MAHRPCAHTALLCVAGGLALLAGCRRPAVPFPPVTTEPLAAQVRAIAARHGVPGVAVAWANSQGEPRVLVVGRRAADRATPLRGDDLLHLGSCTKPITATAAALLVQRGVLHPGATPWPDDETAPALDALLSHTAGLPPLTGFSGPEAAEVGPLLAAPPAVARRRLADWALAHRVAPGRFDYSNAGYVAVSALMEDVTGRPFEDVVRDTVFTPLRMPSAGFSWPHLRLPAGAVAGHAAGDGGRAVRLSWAPLPPALAAASDASASAPDVARFLQAHLRALRGDTSFLSRESTHWLHDPTTDVDPARVAEPARVLGPPLGYARGWAVFRAPDGSHVSWHNGTTALFRCWVVVHPTRDLAFTVLLNRGDAEAAAAEIALELLAGAPVAGLAVVQAAPGPGRAPGLPPDEKPVLPRAAARGGAIRGAHVPPGR